MTSLRICSFDWSYASLYVNPGAAILWLSLSRLKWATPFVNTTFNTIYFSAHYHSKFSKNTQTTLCNSTGSIQCVLRILYSKPTPNIRASDRNKHLYALFWALYSRLLHAAFTNENLLVGNGAWRLGFGAGCMHKQMGSSLVVFSVLLWSWLWSLYMTIDMELDKMSGFYCSFCCI